MDDKIASRVPVPGSIQIQKMYFHQKARKIDWETYRLCRRCRYVEFHSSGAATNQILWARRREQCAHNLRFLILCAAIEKNNPNH